ncbi:MAG: methyltransferase domain-containing protein [Firmicutes bacterium]|nr:methyltransferase domain-containing protein [Bacillota bacterium]
MSNLITKTTELAMKVTLEYIRPGDTAVDATCGTGQDTAALAKAVGEGGLVYAFDIQEKAIRLTAERLKSEGFTNVKLINDSFVMMDSYIPENSIAAAVFNLGYLPGGDHSITTKADDTVDGLKAALKVIRPGGIVTVVLYDGHPEGLIEKKAVLEWARALDPKEYHAVFTDMINQQNDPPEILWITKKA